MSADMKAMMSIELLWIMLPFVVVGLGVWAHFRIKRRKRRSLERSKRPIPVSGAVGDTSEQPNGVQALICKVLGHDRSRRQARQDSETGVWRSVCKRCGRKLDKSGDSGWRAID